ncbi:MAG: hypothetical protein IPH35_21580 [Rhodoferax sp.]|nr:hypothetical protein [Rhodoferax sp.]
MNITPTCRYGHGDLLKVEEETKVWGYVAPNKPTMMFLGNLFICTTCGYTEFFDDEFELTARKATNEHT